MPRTSRTATPEVDSDGATPAFTSIPAHVAIIMDGNGRWAALRGLERSEGHRSGVENIRPVLRSLSERGVKYVTLFAFSTENWRRPEEEVGALMELLSEALRDETMPLHREGVRIRHLGRLDTLSPVLQRAIQESIDLTKDNNRMTLSVAFNYGGRAEIVDAVRSIMADGIAPETITEDVFGQYLYARDIPDPDLVVRTGGEMRLSNFLVWQSAYSEYYSTPSLWPDFDDEEAAKALEAYSLRERRFGKVESGRE